MRCLSHSLLLPLPCRLHGYTRRFCRFCRCLCSRSLSSSYLCRHQTPSIAALHLSFVVDEPCVTAALAPPESSSDQAAASEHKEERGTEKKKAHRQRGGVVDGGTQYVTKAEKKS
mmetsp:Transcript_17538/g.56055  ORF Transcript_17538/g.56055 Transcript_17538/m.56055 type:complete len:115 (-) Transcript_17538:62-406(-)